ncbi:unnamed protein product [Malus baccata var. baccata]
MGSATFIDIIIAILLPPLGVFLKYECRVSVNFSFESAEFWICLVLTLFGYLPGIIYAIYILTNMGRATFLEIVLAILLPPLGVFLQYECRVSANFSFESEEFWICLVLTLFGYLPGGKGCVRRAAMSFCLDIKGTLNCVDILIAILLPPLGVFLKFGCHTSRILRI